MLNGAIARILLRYLAGVLVARGLLMESDGNMFASDPDIAALMEMGVGVALGAISEGWYVVAKRMGWNT